MKIIWNKVTKLSQFVAIVLFVGVFALGLWLGRVTQTQFILGEPIAHAIFECPNGMNIETRFYDRMVAVSIPKAPYEDVYYLPQTISASDARYANKDESFIFWNKGNTAFIQEHDATTIDNCVTK